MVKAKTKKKVKYGDYNSAAYHSKNGNRLSVTHADVDIRRQKKNSGVIYADETSR